MIFLVSYQCCNNSSAIQLSLLSQAKKDKRQVNEKILQIVEEDIGIA